MSVTVPLGFRASGAAAGLKQSGALDIALVVNDGPDHHVAAVYTTNKVVAAPVIWSRQVTADGRADVVFLNSGGANACTGAEGFADTHRTAELVAQSLGCSATDVVVCSTGLIGERLPMERIEAGIALTSQSLSTSAGDDVARAIMTTDSVPKTATYHGPDWSIGATAKGAGMLAPALATMLSVVTTDAVTTAADLEDALRCACAETFDRVDSDGCMSTNDTVVAMASGASGVSVSRADLTAALTQVCADLSRQLIADAEGASHEIAVEVRSADSVADALDVARAVARSALFKTAIFGGDPNWGRVLAAVGTSTAKFNADDLDVTMNGVPVCRGGARGADRGEVDLSAREVVVSIDLHAGHESATVWTNDLTHAYVHENSAYST